MGREEVFQKIVSTLKPAGAIKIAVFGSYARNEENEQSDIDLLVEFKETFGLLKILNLEQTLTQQLGRKVDLLTSRSLSSKIQPYIEKDLTVIFE